MNKKILLAFGALTTFASPLMVVIACSSKSEAENQLEKINKEYQSTYSEQGIKEAIANISKNGEVSSTEKASLEYIGVAQADLDKLDSGWSVKYYLKGEAKDYTGGDLILLARVTKNDDPSQEATQDVKIKPLAEDTEKPTISTKSKIQAGATTKDIAWVDKKATLTIKPDASLQKTDVQALFSVKDNSGEKITPKFTWKDGDQSWAGTNFGSEGIYALEVSAKDSSGKEADKYNLTMQVSAIQGEIEKVDTSPAATKSKEDLSTYLKDKAKDATINQNDWKAKLGLNIKKEDGFNYTLKVKDPWSDATNKAVLTLEIAKTASGPTGPTILKTVLDKLPVDITVTGFTDVRWDSTAAISHQQISVDSSNSKKASVTLNDSKALDQAVMETQIKAALDNDDDDTTIAWDKAYAPSIGQYVATLTTKEGTFTFTVNIIKTPFDFTKDKDQYLGWTFNTTIRAEDFTLKPGEIVTAEQLGFTESEPELSEGVIPTYTIEDVDSQYIWMGVVLTKGEEKTENISFNIRFKLPFNFVYDKEQYTESIFESTWKESEFTKHEGDSVTVEELGIVEPSLTEGIVATYKIESIINGIVTVEVTLTIGRDSDKVLFSVNLQDDEQPKNDS